MSLLADVPVLHGSLVRLEPLSVSHGADLAVAAEEDRSAYGFTVVPRAWEVADYLRAHTERAQAGLMAPFAQIRHGDGRAVGVTAYWDPRFWPALVSHLPGFAPLISAGPGWPPRPSGPASIPRPSC